MCWAFVDSWLLDSSQEAKELMQRQGTRHYFVPAQPTHAHRKKRETRYTVDKPPSKVAAKVETQPKKGQRKKIDLRGMYEYVPATDSREKESKKESNRKAALSTGNEWMYVPAASVKATEKRSKERMGSKSASKVKVSSLFPHQSLSFTSLPISATTSLRPGHINHPLTFVLHLFTYTLSILHPNFLLTLNHGRGRQRQRIRALARRRNAVSSTLGRLKLLPRVPIHPS